MTIVKTQCCLVPTANFQKKNCKSLPLQVSNEALQQSSTEALLSLLLSHSNFQKFCLGPYPAAGTPTNDASFSGLGNEAQSFLHRQLLAKRCQRPRRQSMTFDLLDGVEILRSHGTYNHQRFLQHSLADMHSQIAKHIGVTAQFIVIPAVNYRLGDRHVNNRIGSGL